MLLSLSFSFSSFESSHADVLVKLANETRSSVWDLIPSSGVVKSVDGVTGASVLPPSYPSSQSTNSGSEISEELEVEIKDIKMIELQPYHVINYLSPLNLISNLIYYYFPFSLLEDPTLEV